LTPATSDPSVAADWFDRFEGAGLDGVVAKRLSTRNARQEGWAKISTPHRDCVVAGFRWHKNGPERWSVSSCWGSSTILAAQQRRDHG